MVRARRVVAARQNDDASPRVERHSQNVVGQSAAGMTRHQNVSGFSRNARDARFDEFDAMREARPLTDEAVGHLGGAARKPRVHRQRLGRRVIQKQHQMGNQRVSTREIQDSPTSKPAPRAPRYLPRFEELLPRQTLGLAQRSRHSPKQAIALEAGQIASRQR